MDFRRLRDDVLALLLLVVTVFTAVCLIGYDPTDHPAQTVYPARHAESNWFGPLGAQVAHTLMTTFGAGAWFLLLALLAADIRLFSRCEDRDFFTPIAGLCLALAAVCIVVQIVAPALIDGPPVGSGGYVGAYGKSLLLERFTLHGALILTAACFLAGVILAGEMPLFAFAAAGLAAPVRGLRRRSSKPKKTKPRKMPLEVAGDPDPVDEAPKDEPAEPEDSLDEDALDEEPQDEPEVAEAENETPTDEEVAADQPRQPIRVNPPVTSKRSDREEIIARLDAVKLDDDAEHELPEMDLLEESEDFPYELLAKKARIAAETLERTFQEFGLNVTVAEIDTGPVVTQYELKLEAGLRVSKVTALADDLAIALRVPSVRVVSPIPGKNTVGVEVPNEKQVMVRLRELIESCPKDIEKLRIPIFVGKDVSGRPLTVDLTKMPHLLIAGRTGTGKSVCLNTLILSMLMTRSPDQVKMLMIDPKMVELSPYKRIPHLMHPVITDMKKAEAVLAWAVDKMEERYDLLARCGVRHLDSYNKLGKEKVLHRLGLDPDDPEQMLEAEAVPDRMPYIVIIADEMADMMMTSGKDVEGHIIRLAQKSRAVGIHLVLATQKPTVDVITGLIKSNLPARISFQVASRSDSRVVLDEMGAERLLGNGDMLYLAPGTSNVTRAQGTYVSDDEINGIIEFFSGQEPEYNTELAQLSASSAASGGTVDRSRDDLYDEAIEVVIREGRGSVSLLQRALGIGYGRAARLIDYMAEDGIVGDYNGSQAREVLYTMEQWDELKAGLA